MSLARALSLLLLIPALAPASAQQPPQQPPAAQQAPAAPQGGAPDDRVAALEARVAALEQKVQALTVQGGERERMAEQAAAEIAQLAGAGKMTEAKAKLDEFMGLYASTGAAQRLGRLRDELGVVGKAAPAKLEVEKWFQGGPELPAGKATLLVFFEEWCPHCKREVPKLATLHESLKDKGLVIVGLTRLTRGVTEEQLTSFITQNKISYPIAKETGGLSQYFSVSGIPAAAIVKDGKVVWRGNPARLDAAALQAYL